MESLQDCQLTCVACWIPVRKRTKRDLQSHCRSGSTQLVHGKVSDLATFDPSELGARHPGGAASRLLADTGVESSAQDGRSSIKTHLARDSLPVLLDVVVCRHGRQHCRRHLLTGLLLARRAIRRSGMPYGSRCEQVDGHTFRPLATASSTKDNPASIRRVARWASKGAP